MAAAHDMDTKDSFNNCNIKVVGIDDYSPISSLENSNLDDKIIQVLRDNTILTPTPIQTVCWSIALKGRDIVGIAQTGSGKTLGFLIPAISYILKQPPPTIGDGPICLVLCPTRELAQQVQQTASKFGSPLNILNDCIYGGGNAPKKSALDFFNPHIVIATPGRLITLLEACEASLNACSYLILDEADRMLDLGFKPQIKKIMEYIRPDRQTLMFSATWPRDVHDFASEMLTNYVKIIVGDKGLTANKNIQQIINLCEPYQKQTLLFNLITEISQINSAFKMLVFVRTKKKCNIMNNTLIKKGFNVGCIHGDKQQNEREQVLQEFKESKMPILVATSVASRGLDVDDIHFVVNFDFPDTMEDYVHRIGRTARFTKTGIAYSFFTPKNYHMADGLFEMLRDCGQTIPEKLPGIASRFGRCREEKQRKRRESRSRSRSLEKRRRNKRSSSRDKRKVVDKRRGKKGEGESEDSTASDMEEKHNVAATATATSHEKKEPVDPLVLTMRMHLQKQQQQSSTTITTTTITPYFGNATSNYVINSVSETTQTESLVTTGLQNTASTNAYDNYLAIQASQLFKQQNPDLYKQVTAPEPTQDPKTSKESGKRRTRSRSRDRNHRKRRSKDSRSRSLSRGRSRKRRSRSRSIKRSSGGSYRHRPRDRDDRSDLESRKRRSRSRSKNQRDRTYHEKNYNRGNDRERNYDRDFKRRDRRFDDRIDHHNIDNRIHGLMQVNPTSAPTFDTFVPNKSHEMNNFESINASNMAMMQNMINFLGPTKPTFPNMGMDNFNQSSASYNMMPSNSNGFNYPVDMTNISGKSLNQNQSNIQTYFPPSNYPNNNNNNNTFPMSSYETPNKYVSNNVNDYSYSSINQSQPTYKNQPPMNQFQHMPRSTLSHNPNNNNNNYQYHHGQNL